MMRRFWDWLRRTIGLVIVREVTIVRDMAADGKRFHVIYTTDGGAEARDVYASLTPRNGAVELFDGVECRGRKMTGG